MTTAEGCVITVVACEVQPFASVAVTAYIPAVRLLIVADVDPVFQRYEYPAVPFDANEVAEPVEAPLHKTFVVEGIDTVKTLGCVTFAVVDAVHPLASVAVTVYTPAVKLLIVEVVAPVFQRYEYPAVPFDANEVAEPVEAPLHKTFVVEGIDTANKVGCVIVAVVDVVHPLASVAVTVYVPAVRLLLVAVVDPVFQRYEYPPVPLDATEVAEPVEAPLHNTLVVEGIEIVSGVGCVIVAVVDVVHPFASVAVTVYVPAVRLLIVEVADPVFQRYEYPAVPFDATEVAEPVEAPLHKTFIVDGIDTVNKPGCVIVAFVDVVHPLASVTVTVYVPAVRLLIVAVVDPVFHK
jgi:predicted RNA methylase